MDVVIVDGTDRYVMLRGCGFVMRFFDTIRFFCHGGLLVDLVVCLMDHILLRWYHWCSDTDLTDLLTIEGF
jgi:hypothetical protein